MFHIDEVVISAEREEHIWSRPRVTPEEVEEVCYSEPWVLRGRDDSYAVYGQTDAGRYLVVFLYPRGRGVFGLATAREMTRAERQRYQRIRGR